MDPGEILAERFPQLAARELVVIEHGWDSLVYEVDGEWIFRFPRRPEVERWIEAELALLPELAQVLPVAVPRYELVARNGVLCAGYRKLIGEPASTGVDERTGADLGAFLTALHGFPAERARRLGVRSFEPPSWRDRFGELAERFRTSVLPQLAPAERPRAEAVFAVIDELDFQPALVHADMGPEHVLVREGRIAGVIDWSDARVGDPALDLAWPLNGAARSFADGLAGEYSLDDPTRERSLFYYRLAPWYEVAYALDLESKRDVERGLADVRARLPR